MSQKLNEIKKHINQVDIYDNLLNEKKVLLDICIKEHNKNRNIDDPYVKELYDKNKHQMEYYKILIKEYETQKEFHINEIKRLKEE